MTAEQETLAALDAWKAAMIAKDRAAMDAILHPDVAYSHSNCRTETKDDILSKLDGPGGAQAIEFSNIITRVAGDAAFAKADVDYTNRGKDGGKWRLFARQATRRP